MNMEVITRRAQQLIGIRESDNYLDDELRVVPSWKFNCNGNITSLLLGVELKEGKSEYPEIQVWRRTSTRFNLISSRAINLTSGTFSTDGVIRYDLSPPLSVEAGDMLGVKQPKKDETAVQIFYQQDHFAPYAYHLSRDDNTFLVNAGIISQQYILLSVITGIAVHLILL